MLAIAATITYLARSHTHTTQAQTYTKRLTSLTTSTIERTAAGFSPEERLPQQSELDDLVSELDRWPHHPSLSRAYETLIECGNKAHIIAYSFDDLPTSRTCDGWLLLIDASTRSQLYSKAKPTRADAHGGNGSPMLDQTGESPIDNAVLANVLSPPEAKELLVTDLITKRLVFRIIRKHQKHILTSLGLVPDPGPEIVRNRLQHASESELASAHIDPNSISFSVLARTGFLLHSLGQLDDKERADVYSALAPRSEEGSEETTEDEDDDSVLEEFREFCLHHPGKLFRGSKEAHAAALVGGMWSGKIDIVKRSCMERHTRIRYLGSHWVRSAPLVSFPEAEDGAPVEIRSPGDTEYSRFRMNEFPYGPSHGLGINSSGIAETRQVPLLFELGNSMPQDPRAKTGNWFATDFEKILVEVVKLNPSNVHARSPHDVWHDVSQNPQAASSIGKTAHTQITRSCLSDWPFLLPPDGLGSGTHHPSFPRCLFFFRPIPSPSPSCSDDNNAGLLLQFYTSTPSHPDFVAALVALRLAVTAEFGGRNIDFVCHAVPDDASSSDTFFMVSLAIVAALSPHPSTPGVLINPLTGESSSSLLYSAVDAASIKGSLLIDSNPSQHVSLSGPATMASLFSFVRVPDLHSFLTTHM